MIVVVRLADLLNDRTSIIAGLRQHLNPLTDDRRFNWLYVDNPDGPARVWVIEDPMRQQIVGTCAVLPRYLYVEKAKVLGCVITDTWVHPDYRALGPVLKLQRGCMTDISPDRFRLGYDFPRQAMIAVYKRLGIAPRDNLVDFVRLLKLNSFLTNRLGNNAAVRLLARVANPLMRFVGPRTARCDVAIGLEDEACGPEYTEMHEANVGDSVCVARTAEYLNWRYRKHFHHRHEFLVARRAGRLVGYVVFINDGLRAVGLDLVCEDDERLYRTLLSSLMQLLTCRGCQALRFSALASDRLASTLRALGFRPMGETPFVVLPAEDLAAQLNGCGYSFTLGHEPD